MTVSLRCVPNVPTASIETNPSINTKFLGTKATRGAVVVIYLLVTRLFIVK